MLFFVAYVVATLSIVCLGDDVVNKIINGEAMDQPLPFLVSLRAYDPVAKKVKHVCGGAILDETHVVTAAHCYVPRRCQKLKQITVVAGLHKMSELNRHTVTTHYVVKVFRHRNYENTFSTNDIAVFEVTPPIVMIPAVISPIPIATVPMPPGTKCNVSGWGKMANGQNADILQTVQLPVISADVCGSRYSLFTGMMCAGWWETGGQDACQGDSGGPLVCEDKLAGLSSWGDKCGAAYSPGVYTDIAYFKHWIAQQLN